MQEQIFAIDRTEDSPIVATAIHDGHSVREELRDLYQVSEADRLREEDPHTRRWTAVAPVRVVGLRSRFQVDLNRPRARAVYVEPADAWGIPVWKKSPDPTIITRSLAEYDAFYEGIGELLTQIVNRFGRAVVLDLHSYNHRRAGPDAPPADPIENPEVNIGTGTMNPRWRQLADRFIRELRDFNYLEGNLDVRENVKFRGGQLARWTHENYPESVCVLAVEFKKFFMDEWTGQPYEDHIEAIHQALQSAVPGLMEELGAL